MTDQELQYVLQELDIRQKWFGYDIGVTLCENQLPHKWAACCRIVWWLGFVSRQYRKYHD